jgi:glycosyltransferase involved in cell wall biosynthesis
LRGGKGGRIVRVALFTDTLGDVNGVSRFIRDAAQRALEAGRDLRVYTSTRFPVPERPNLLNVPPVAAGRMPRYENLEVVIPPVRGLSRLVEAQGPDVVHVSTPGPVGLVGRRWALRRGVPLLGVYHTDFPAYVERLFEDATLTWVSSAYMRWFYGPFRAVFTRSRGYAGALAGLGIPRDRVVELEPGIDTAAFHPRHRDAGVWARRGWGRPGSVKVLSVGRVSVEKNLPMLADAWRGARPRLRAAGIDAELIVVGDGPYRERMERELGGMDARFLGFRHGAELSALYASSDLFVFPSATDTLGQVVMEAQASGLPVLVSDRGGPKEVMRDGTTGLVLPVSAGRWSEAVHDLVLDPARRGRMGRAAHEWMRPRSFAASFDQFWREHGEAARPAQ